MSSVRNNGGQRSLIVTFYLSVVVIIVLMNIMSTLMKSKHRRSLVLDGLLTNFKLSNGNDDQRQPSPIDTNANNIKIDTTTGSSNNNINDDKDDEDWRSAKTVFRQILQRAIKSRDFCSSTPALPSVKTELHRMTNVTLPPEFGVIDAASEWLSKTNIPPSEMCQLPPPKSCDEDKFTVVFMSYAGSKHVKRLTAHVENVASWEKVREVILVWNSPRNELALKELLSWDLDPRHKFRIFTATDHGLSNNLFNRYHPAISPRSSALLYFDDDGPVFRMEAILKGFELWRRNSGTQVGCFVRKIDFINPDKRMEKMMETEIIVGERQILNGWQSISPYDAHGTRESIASLKNYDDKLDRHPRFVPTCREAGDHLAYNYEEFHPYRAHMTLPSGTFMHRDFLCFMWHPVFARVRQFVLDHPTHADDVTASTFATQVAGKSLRSYVRRVKSRKQQILDEINNEKINVWDKIIEARDKKINKLEEKEKKYEQAMDVLKAVNKTLVEKHRPKRRRLLWNHDDWADLRSEAVNSIIGFFGSINPGSVGYCLGTAAHDRKTRMCHGENNHNYDFAVDANIPWMIPGMLGYDQCGMQY